MTLVEPETAGCPVSGERWVRTSLRGLAKALGHRACPTTLGRLLREAKNLPGAAQEFYNAAQADPKALAAWRELASTLFLLGNYQGTLSAFDKLRELGEETPAQWYLRALCYDRMQLYKEALPAYEKFLSVSEGESPEEEFKARQRIRVVKKVLAKK